MPVSQLVVLWILFGVLFGVRPRIDTGEQPYSGTESVKVHSTMCRSATARSL